MWQEPAPSDRVSGIRSVVALVCGSHRCMLVLLFALLVVAVVFLFHDKYIYDPVLGRGKSKRRHRHRRKSSKTRPSDYEEVSVREKPAEGFEIDDPTISDKRSKRREHSITTHTMLKNTASGPNARTNEKHVTSTAPLAEQSTQMLPVTATACTTTMPVEATQSLPPTTATATMTDRATLMAPQSLATYRSVEVSKATPPLTSTMTAAIGPVLGGLPSTTTSSPATVGRASTTTEAAPATARSPNPVAMYTKFPTTKYGKPSTYTQSMAAKGKPMVLEADKLSQQTAGTAVVSEDGSTDTSDSLETASSISSIPETERAKYSFLNVKHSTGKNCSPRGSFIMGEEDTLAIKDLDLFGTEKESKLNQMDMKQLHDFFKTPDSGKSSDKKVSSKEGQVSGKTGKPVTRTASGTSLQSGAQKKKKKKKKKKGKNRKNSGLLGGIFRDKDKKKRVDKPTITPPQPQVQKT